MQSPGRGRAPRSRVLAINPGSTSTKFGLYTRQGAEWVRTVRHGDEELRRFGDRPMVARLEYRAAMIAESLEELHYSSNEVAGVAGRGGLLPPVSCGTYLVDDAMVEELYLARRGEHASNLGALLALTLCACRECGRLHRGSGDCGRVAGLRAAFRFAAD